MYRLDHSDLALAIDLAVSRAFRRHGKLMNTRADRGRLESLVANEVKRDLVNDHVCVVRAGTSGHSHEIRHKSFGTDEPWPAPLSIEIHARPAKG